LFTPPKKLEHLLSSYVKEAQNLASVWQKKEGEEISRKQQIRPVKPASPSPWYIKNPENLAGPRGEAKPLLFLGSPAHCSILAATRLAPRAADKNNQFMKEKHRLNL
jgi:hypothetical protein